MQQPNSQQASRLHNDSTVGINVGRISDEQAKNIVRELKYLWHNLDKVTPKAEVRAARGYDNQVFIYLNGQALKYLLLFAKDWKPYELDTPLLGDLNKQARRPMPDDFAI